MELENYKRKKPVVWQPQADQLSRVQIWLSLVVFCVLVVVLAGCASVSKQMYVFDESEI